MGSDLNRSGGGWSLEVNRPYSWAWADTFTADECDRIIELAHFDMTEATTFGGVTDYRQSSVRFLQPFDHAGEVKPKMLIVHGDNCSGDPLKHPAGGR